MCYVHHTQKTLPLEHIMTNADVMQAFEKEILKEYDTSEGLKLVSRGQSLLVIMYLFSG